MQKKMLLGSTLALSLVLPAQSFAADSLLKNFKLGGQIDLQATAAKNVTDFQTRQVPGAAATANDRIGDAQTRIMVHADWDVLDDVHAVVTLRKNDRNYGTAGGGNANFNANSQRLMGTAGNTGALDNTFLDQAYVKIDKLGGAVDATFGRQFYGTSGDMVIYYGPSDKAAYGLWTTSIDAVRADWSNDMVGVTGLVGKVTGHALGVAGAADVDVRGLTATLKGHENMGLGAYIYNQVTHNIGASGVAPSNTSAGGLNDFLYVAGLKGKVAMGMAWVSGEFAKNFGQNRLANSQGPASRSYTGWAAKADLGVKVDVPGLGAVAPWGHFGYGSGDGSPNDGNNHAFTAISPDYRPGSIYGRFAVPVGGASLASGVTAGVASNSLSNREIWGVGVKTTPGMLNKLTAGVSYWSYNLAARPQGLVAAGQKHIGSEADLDLTWAHSENVSLGAGIGEFWAGGVLKDAQQSQNGVAGSTANSGKGNNPAGLAYFDVRVKF